MRETEDEAVVDHVEQHRYELRLDGLLLALLDYRPVRGRLILQHAETAPGRHGHGHASRVVRAALDDIRRRGGKIEPVCGFVRAFVAEHPEYADLVFRAEPDPLLEGQQRF
ncbi:MAG: GNAT family N-acetyltransferase [Sporichthyaceae bacterium]